MFAIVKNRKQPIYSLMQKWIKHKNYMTMNKTILITGANAGIGKDVARQLALIVGTEKIYLGCRNEGRALAAKKELEDTTGKDIFEIVLMDVSDTASVRAAVGSLTEPIDALIMNAGGMGGKTPEKRTAEGVTQLFGNNVLGHVVLLEELIKENKLNNVALYAGSEAARGVPKMGMKRPALETSSADEFAGIIDGTFYGDNFDVMQAYGPVKYVAAQWMSSLARKYPDIRFVTMSPGGTGGTEVMQDLTGLRKIMFKYIGVRLMPLMGMMHKLEVGSKRFVDGINDAAYKSGIFYASSEKVLTGPVMDQSLIFPDLKNETFQDNAYNAIHRFIN